MWKDQGVDDIFIHFGLEIIIRVLYLILLDIVTPRIAIVVILIFL